MLVLSILLAGLISVSEDSTQHDIDASDAEIAQLCKHYVAYFETDLKIRYLKDWSQRNFPDLQKWFDNKEEIPNRKQIREDLSIKIDTLSFRGQDDISLYSAEVTDRKFLNLDICIVYPPDRHSRPYKLGVVGAGPNLAVHFFNLSGFSERIRFQDDNDTYKSYDDELDLTVHRYLDGSGFTLVHFVWSEVYYSLVDFPLKNDRRIEEFVADWIQLTRYDGHPLGFKLLSSEYGFVDGDLVGTCRTEELESESARKVYKEWKFEIFEFSFFNRKKPKLELVTISADE